MDIQFLLNNIEVNPPNNYQDIFVQLNYDRDVESGENIPTVSTNTWEWGLGQQNDPLDGARIINAWLNAGYVTEGLPLQILLTDDGNTQTLFDGYLDPQTAQYDCDLVSIDAVEKKQIDWLNSVADSVTYERLYNKGSITDSDFLSIPYIISTIPNSFQAMLAIISMFTMVYAFSAQLEALLENLAGALNPLQFMDIVKLVLRGVYVATLFTTLVVIIKQIINLLVQPVKYHKAMYTRVLLERGAAEFGYTFSSSIYSASSGYYNEVILPRKFNQNVNADKDDVLGWLNPTTTDTYGYYLGTFGDLIRKLKIKYNAKIFFVGNQLRLERKDYRLGAPIYQLPPIEGQDFRADAYRLNTEELISNKTIEFLLDGNDKNTYQRYSGTLTQIITSAKNVINPDYKLLKSFEERVIQFARGNRKNGYTIIENIIRGFAVAIDPLAEGIVSLFNGIMSIFETFFDIIDTVLGVLILVGINTSSQQIIDGFNDFLDTLGVPRAVPIILTSGSPLIIFLALDVDVDNLPRLEWDNIGNAIEDRPGMLLLENDFISVDKMFTIVPSSTPRDIDLSPTDFLYENTAFIYNEYHAIDSFVPSSGLPNANQYKIYTVDDVPFCFQDYLDVRNNNYILTADGKTAELLSLEWNVISDKRTAKIRYRVNELYTNNLKEEIITLDGK